MRGVSLHRWLPSLAFANSLPLFPPSLLSPRRQFLEATKDFKIDGTQLRVWLGLFPPSEASPFHNGTLMCQPPPDSPLTPFNETALWAGDNYTNYTRWGDLAGRLGALYPHLVALDIDDFSSNVVTG